MKKPSIAGRLVEKAKEPSSAGRLAEKEMASIAGRLAGGALAPAARRGEEASRAGRVSGGSRVRARARGTSVDHSDASAEAPPNLPTSEQSPSLRSEKVHAPSHQAEKRQRPPRRPPRPPRHNLRSPPPRLLGHPRPQRLRQNHSPANSVRRPRRRRRRQNRTRGASEPGVPLQEFKVRAGFVANHLQTDHPQHLRSMKSSSQAATPASA